MKYSKDHILEQQAHLKRLGLPHVPYADMLKPQNHTIFGYPAATGGLGCIGIPCGYIGVLPLHSMYGISEPDVNKLGEDLGIVYAGDNPSLITVFEHKTRSVNHWYFGIDTGNNFYATRQDLIKHLRLIAVFLNERGGQPQT